MEIKVTQEIVDTICNSLRASKQTLIRQLVQAADENKKAILTQQLTEVKEALGLLQTLEV